MRWNTLPARRMWKRRKSYLFEKGSNFRKGFISLKSAHSVCESLIYLNLFANRHFRAAIDEEKRKQTQSNQEFYIFSLEWTQFAYNKRDFFRKRTKGIVRKKLGQPAVWKWGANNYRNRREIKMVWRQSDFWDNSRAPRCSREYFLGLTFANLQKEHVILFSNGFFGDLGEVKARKKLVAVGYDSTGAILRSSLEDLVQGDARRLFLTKSKAELEEVPALLKPGLLTKPHIFTNLKLFAFRKKICQSQSLRFARKLFLNSRVDTEQDLILFRQIFLVSDSGKPVKKSFSAIIETLFWNKNINKNCFSILIYEKINRVECPFCFFLIEQL